MSDFKEASWVSVTFMFTFACSLNVFGATAPSPPMDLDWLAPTILAFGSLIGSVVAAMNSHSARKDAAAAKEQSVANGVKVEKLGEGIDGKMELLLKKEGEKATAEATLAEKLAQSGREEANAAQGERRSVKSTAEAVLATAEERAGKVLKDAEEVAAALREEARVEARRVSIANESTNPMPVHVVTGPGVDSALHVSETGKKKSGK